MVARTASKPRKSGAKAKAKGGMSMGAGDLKLVANVLVHPVTRRVYGTVLVVLSFVLLYRYCLDDLQRRPRFQVMTQDLQLLQVPTWIPPEEAAGIVQMPADVGETISIFDPKLVQMVYEVYSRSPWVDKVHRVEKVYPNGLRVYMDLRKPEAAVWRANRGRYLLVDKNGVLLPGEYQQITEAMGRLPILAGVLAPPPTPGQAWPDNGLLDGARLAARLREQGRLNKLIDVHTIDVGNVDGRKDSRRPEVLMNLGGGGSDILWGRVTRPGRPDVIGVNDQKKMQILENALVREGYLDRDPQLRQFKAIDVGNGKPRFIRR